MCFSITLKSSKGNRVTHLRYRIRKAVTASAPDAQNLSGSPA